MAINPLVIQFWQNRSQTKPSAAQKFFYERVDTDSRYTLLRKILAKFTPTDEFIKKTENDSVSTRRTARAANSSNSNSESKSTSGNVKSKELSLKDYIMLKKDSAQSDSVAATPNVENDNDQAAVGPAVLGFTEEDQAILTQVQNEVSKKYLEMYYDAYMSPIHSDNQWRLGPVTGTFIATENIDDPTGALTSDGEVYTRSNMHVGFEMPMCMGGRVYDQKVYYSNLYFPPYKIGKYNPIHQQSELMPEILLNNPDATFDLDRFALKKDGSKGNYTYRDPGFKSVNDNIMFIQWLIEQTTGVISTFLTEWDLSIYMQEGMIAPAPNGGPLKLYLNYRVRNDNPLATEGTGYLGDKALAFSVINSAVSKLDFDCQKPWRPSDFPLTAYWQPYQKDVDYEIKKLNLTDPDTEEVTQIFYASWVNEPPTYDYKGETLQHILRHQDFIGMALGCWPNTDMSYYQTLYYTDSDVFADTEIWQQTWLKKVCGAQGGAAAACGKSLGDFLLKAKQDNIGNGGLTGTMTGAGMGGITGGKGGSRSLKKVMDKVAGGFGGEEDAGNKMANELMQSVNSAGSGVANAIQGNDGPLAGIGKVDASTMSNLNGINRFSPALFGGPHGSSLSPHSLQSFYDVENKFMRNTPRISPEMADNFSSIENSKLFSGVNKYYNNEFNTGTSPSKALYYLQNGITNYTIDYYTEEITKTELIKGEVKFLNGKYSYNFPQTIKGKRVSYYGDVIYKSKTEFVSYRIWGNTLLDRSRYWQQYYSYWNNFNIRRGPFLKNGEWGYDTTTFEVYRYGKTSDYRVKPYKKYLMHDMPDVEWTITQHKYGKYTADNTEDSPLWNLMSQVQGLFGIRKNKEYSGQITGQKTVFTLEFNDQSQKDEFVQKMMLEGRSGNQKVPLIFCEGNISQRYKYGPESIFVADCQIQYVDTLYTYKKLHTYIAGAHGRNLGDLFGSDNTLKQGLLNFLLSLGLLRRTSHYDTETVLRRVPFITVDLNGNIPLFVDKLNKNGFTNRFRGNQLKSLEVDSMPEEKDYTDHAGDVLQKFKPLKYTIGSYVYTDKKANLTRSMTRSGTQPPVNGIDMPPGAVPSQYKGVTKKREKIKGLPLTALPPQQGAKTLKNLFNYATRNRYESPGYTVHQFNSDINPDTGKAIDDGKPEDLYTGPIILVKKTIWESKAEMGIKGIGILSQVQAFNNGDIENVPSMNFKRYMFVDSVSTDIPLAEINRKTHSISFSGSEKHLSQDDMTYFTNNGVPEYSESDMDMGLKYALTNLMTRSTFYREDYEKEFLVSLDTQFRLFYQLVVRQLTFLKTIKENIIDSIDFEIMRKVLLECVDKCVTKVHGLTVDGPCDVDKSHVLYNYWMEVAVKLWSDPEKHVENKQKVVDSLNVKISKYENAKTVLEGPVTKKTIRDWTYNEIMNSYSCVNLLSDEMDISDFEKYMFAYINCLYYYRLFFVGKRFNKEDGTMWVMRALESILEFIAPHGSNDNPPNIAKLAKHEQSYNVSFYELQNTSEMKKQSVLTETALEEDRIQKVYVKVKWVNKQALDDYILYTMYPKKYKPSPEVVEIKQKIKGKTKLRYAELPTNDVYTLISKEYLADQKNIKWNNLHPKSPQKQIRSDMDVCSFYIEWGDRSDLTPIKYNIFNSMKVGNILEYSIDSVSPEELMCLAKEGADYWTVNIPKELWPRATGYVTKLKLKHYDAKQPTSHLMNDPIITLCGSMGYSLFPIVETQERPFPGVGSPDSLKNMIAQVS